MLNCFFVNKTLALITCNEKNTIPNCNQFLVDTSGTEKHQNNNDYYPFELQNFNGQFNIVVNIESAGLYPKYYNFFKKYGYEGNGYCWEGHIKQILSKLDKSLISKIDFDPEAGTFFAIAKDQESQLKFVKLLSPIFSDFKVLAIWVKKPDRSKNDD